MSFFVSVRKPCITLRAVESSETEGKTTNTPDQFDYDTFF